MVCRAAMTTPVQVDGRPGPPSIGTLRRMTMSVDGWWGRIVQRMAGARWFGRVAPQVVPPVDRALHRLSGGRFLLSQRLVPTLVLTTTGRRSGEARESPLACLAEPGGTFVVVGSNFGQAQHPAWTANLIAEPRATVTWERRRIDVRAELLDDAAKAAIWPELVRIWPTYDTYVERSGRNLRVFRLRPVSDR
jgi:deazaflavin-dependent oxidoreductase (nitroreductase family)